MNCLFFIGSQAATSRFRNEHGPGYYAVFTGCHEHTLPFAASKKVCFIVHNGQCGGSVQVNIFNWCLNFQSFSNSTNAKQYRISDRASQLPDTLSLTGSSHADNYLLLFINGHSVFIIGSAEYTFNSPILPHPGKCLWTHTNSMYSQNSIYFSSQVLALLWLLVSYIPGGQTGLRFMTNLFRSAVKRSVSQTLPVWPVHHVSTHVI